MAGTRSESSIDLLAKLSAEGKEYGFFQAVRLLEKLEDVRVDYRPYLGLSFPGTDIASIELMGPKHVRITASFLGLYGVTSPLPTFYTEDLLAEYRDGGKACREFLDMLTNRLYDLFYQAWLKHQLPFKLYEGRSETYQKYLYAFAGLAEPKVRSQISDHHRILRYLGIFNQQRKTLSDLTTLLRDYFKNKNIEIQPCVLYHQPIAADQLTRLGRACSHLGESAILGMRVPDRSATIRIELSQLDDAAFRSFAPGSMQAEQLKNLLRFYLRQPLRVLLRLNIKPEALSSARLTAGKWNSLGFDTWLGRAYQPDLERIENSREYVLCH
jgi:type VI secretion system protein ImpH